MKKPVICIIEKSVITAIIMLCFLLLPRIIYGLAHTEWIQDFALGPVALTQTYSDDATEMKASPTQMCSNVAEEVKEQRTNLLIEFWTALVLPLIGIFLSVNALIHQINNENRVLEEKAYKWFYTQVGDLNNASIFVVHEDTPDANHTCLYQNKTQTNYEYFKLRFEFDSLSPISEKIKIQKAVLAVRSESLLDSRRWRPDSWFFTPSTKNKYQVFYNVLWFGFEAIPDALKQFEQGRDRACQLEVKLTLKMSIEAIGDYSAEVFFDIKRNMEKNMLHTKKCETRIKKEV